MGDRVVSGLDAARLRGLLNYDQQTGVFTWAVARSARKAGDATGCMHSSGYLLIGVDGRLHRAHRLAWLYVHGEWPNGDVDHINGVRHDNRLENLRVVSRKVNSQNRRTAKPGNKSGRLGVTKFRKRFKAVISVDGKSQYLGLFDDAETAHAAYVVAKRQRHEGCTL